MHKAPKHFFLAKEEYSNSRNKVSSTNERNYWGGGLGGLQWKENHAKLLASPQSYKTGDRNISSGTSLIAAMGSEITSTKLGNKIMNRYKIQ